MKADILLIDDEENLRAAAVKILAKQGHRVSAFASPDECLAKLAREGADLVITDLLMPGMDGIAVLKRAKEIRPAVEVIVLTAHASVDKAVEAMRLGAYDFIEKPLDRAALLKAVGKALERQRLTGENRQLREQLGQLRTEESLVGNSPGMLAVKNLIRQIAATDVSVLIQGETGTGKEVVADILHALSPRREKALVKISCAAIPETLLESELFGYERGAFTGAANAKAGKFELAQGGTLFLDEIAEMSPPLQAKLLRVVQDGRFQRLGGTRDLAIDFRLLSATHVDIPKAIEENKFRTDLYYRLNVVTLTLPALRDRRADIPLLADHLLQKHAARMQKPVRTIAPAAMEQLLAHAWPGNVRELENVIQSALATATDETIRNFSLLALNPNPAHAHPTSAGRALTIPIGIPLAVVEGQIICETLKACGGDKQKAAQLLGVSERTLYRHVPRPDQSPT
jgi:two-component system, NtrC family, response regulator HydG